MLNKLAKWLSKLLPNHKVTITLEPMGKPKAVAAAPAETADMKRWRLLQDHQRELNQKAAENKGVGGFPDRASYHKHWYEQNKKEVLERQREARIAKAKAEGREIRGWSKRDLPVSYAKDGNKAYMKAYHAQVKATGNNKKTFN